MKENPIIKTFKKMLESMPVEETAKMFVYKLVKSEQCREYEIACLILLLQKLGCCKDDFYNEKLAELVPDNRTEIADLFDELICNLVCPKEGEDVAGTP